MCKLILNAPYARVGTAAHCKSFSSILNNQIGPDYAIFSDIHDKINFAIKDGHKVQVVLLCKDRQKRAEGLLDHIIYKSTARNHVKRYDVSILKLKSVPYISESLNRCGVNFIPCV